MYFRIVHHGRKWPLVANHLDARHCPECGASVHGNHGQHEHRAWHDTQQELLVMLCQRTGITEEMVDVPWSWTAVVDGSDEPEAIDG
jgi:hypothetical protein